MKKILNLVLLIVFALCACLLTVGCQPVEGHEHDYAKFLERVEPTCSAMGKEVYECSCGKKKTITLEIDQSKHEYLTQLKTDEQKHWKECELCGRPGQCSLYHGYG